MQNFTDIPSSRTLSDSLIEILNNDKTAISCNSGTTFPTTNLQIGMLCYRTDQLKLYQLIGTNPDNWRFIMDLSSGIDAQFAAKLNAASYTAADVLAKLLTVDGAGTGLDADLLDGQHASAFASSTHNHNATYLGITAKAADADKLDGYDSTAFVRSVNGAGPDAAGNATVNIDLSSRVAKTGDTMTGNLTIQNTAPTINMQDTDNVTRSLHVNSNLMGFLNSGGGWDMYANNSGQVWAANYGWLHDYFFSAVGNCVRISSLNGSGVPGGNTGNCSPGESGVVNCYGTGNITTRNIELTDSGSSVGIRVVNQFYNCNCNCACDCNCGFCFPAGTMVTLAAGVQRPIEEINIGAVLRSGIGGTSTVYALHRPLLGRRIAYRINGQIVTTGDHMFKTTQGWASIDADLYQALRYKVPYEAQGAAGSIAVVGSAIDPSKVDRLEVGCLVLTQDGSIVIESIEALNLPSDTQLYSLVTAEAPTFIADGFVVDGAPQEDF